MRQPVFTLRGYILNTQNCTELHQVGPSSRTSLYIREEEEEETENRQKNNTDIVRAGG